MPLYEPQVQIDLVRLWEGPEVLGSVEYHVACPIDPGELLGGEPNHGIGLAVLQVDIVLRLPLLDEIVLEDQGFVFRVGYDDFDAFHGGDEKSGLYVLFPREIGSDPILQRSRLSDVNDGGFGIPHDVNPRFVGVLAIAGIFKNSAFHFAPSLVNKETDTIKSLQ